MRPKKLAIELSRLQQHPQLSVELEQYPTEGDLAAFLVLAIDQLDQLEGKHVVDLGAGNGILGIGCTYLGCSKVTMIEGDLEVAKIAQQNSLEIMPKNNCKIEVVGDMITNSYDRQIENADIVVLNPPWGFQTPKADRPIVDYAFRLQPKVVYVIHSAKSNHLSKIGKEFGYDCEIVFQSNFRLPPKFAHQSRKMKDTEVKCWRFYLPGNKKIFADEEE